MVPVPSFDSVPDFATGGSWVQPGPSAYSSGYLAGQVLPAEHANWFLGSLTANGNTEQQSITSVVTELDNLLTYYSITPASGTNTQVRDLMTPYLDNIKNMVTEFGLTWDPTDAYILSKAEIAGRKVLGEVFTTDVKETQVIFSAAKSSANPSYPQYNPVIARDVDKTVTTAMAPNLVPKFRAFKASVLGNTDFSGTVSGSVITFGVTTTITAMLNAIINEGYVRRWFSSGQSATFAVSGPDYTGMTVTINGTEYGISSINTATGALTTTGTPTSGSQTMNLYPYRIAGSTTSIQLPRLSGFVPAGSDDVDGYEIGGYRHMDQFQGHVMSGTFAYYGGSSTFAAGTVGNQTSVTGGPVSDGANGNPRFGKKTAPQTTVKFIYTHVDYLAAAV